MFAQFDPQDSHPLISFLRARWLLVAYILAVAIVFLHPNPEELVVKLVERAGLAIIVVRGLKGHYDDFAGTFTQRREPRGQNGVRREQFCD